MINLVIDFFIDVIIDVITDIVIDIITLWQKVELIFGKYRWQTLQITLIVPVVTDWLMSSQIAIDVTNVIIDVIIDVVIDVVPLLASLVSSLPEIFYLWMLFIVYWYW